jgi:group I intron endonuclease
MNKFIKISPIMSYTNTEINKIDILKENNNRSGIYLWHNKITDKLYIGSSVNLSKRLRCYFSIGYLRKVLLKNNSLISTALLKYGYSEFNLHILEYCDKNILINREQHYINLLDPDYNILKTAGSRLGVKYSLETLKKLKNSKKKGITISLKLR